MFIATFMLSCGVFLVAFEGRASAGNFSAQTGSYVGTGSSGLSISGVGFQPDFVMIKSSTNAGVAVFKTSAMPANTTAFTSATANDTGTNITLDSDGFTLGTLVNVNSANVVYYWTAVGGSDCSATGNFCVGTYTGNGVSPRNITVGFQPEMAIVKRTTNIIGHFRVASQLANETLLFDGTAQDTSGNYIRSFGATDFAVGATDNANGGIYYYAVFSTTAGSFAEGTFSGTGVDRDITGLGFQPDFVLVKNATSGNPASNRQPVMSFNESYGESSSFVANAAANVVDHIEELLPDGFNLGTANPVNRSGSTIYWFAIGGAAGPSASGSFDMDTGSYVGTGAANSISGLGFKPDLVIVKANTAQLGVFRTATMQGNSTAHMSAATANFTGGITSLDADGFTLGTAVQTNSNGVTYQWQAFGGAFDPYDNDGASDFMIGAYYGNGIDIRNITRLPSQPDMITIKSNTANVGIWGNSAAGVDSSSYFGATSNAPNFVQAYNTDGFEIGNGASVNANAALNHWFAFAEGSNFAVGTYTGTGATQTITDAGFRAENVWIKRSTAVSGVQRAVTLSGDATQYYVATANVTDRITGYVKGGFRVGGNQAESNATGGTYYYAAWNNPNYGTLSNDIVDASDNSVAAPVFGLNTLALNFSCAAIDGTLGTASQKLKISNLTTSAGWSASIAATFGATDAWSNAGNTEFYDFNDGAGSPAGCADGGDADSYAGQLTIDPSVATLSAEPGCVNTDVSLGGAASFVQGVTDSIELITAGASANADCIWDVTGIDMSQYIPAEQPVGSYDLNLTITVVAN